MIRRFDGDGGIRRLACASTSVRGSAPPRDGSARPLSVVYCVAVPARTQLVEDPEGGGAVAIAVHEDGFEVVRLDATPPTFRPEAAAARAGVAYAPKLASQLDCDRPEGARKQVVERLRNENYLQNDATILGRIARAKRKGPTELLDLTYALRLAGLTAMWQEAVRTVAEAFPDHPEALMLDARHQIALSRWDLARERAVRVDPAPLEPSQARHAHHLLAHALLVAGEHAEALEVLRRGERFEGTCELGFAFALATPLDDPDAEGGGASGPTPSGNGGAAREWKADELAVRELMRAVRTADACLGAGDAAGAIRALDTLLVHDLREVQSLARLAEAYLAPQSDGPSDPFDKALALATFCGAHAETGPFVRTELPLSQPPWDKARLDELAARAKAWLAEPPSG